MNNEIINIIRTYFGTDRVGFKSILVISSLFLVSAWLPDGIVSLFSVFFPEHSTAWVQLGVPVLLMILAFFWFRHIADTHELTVKIEHRPPTAKALILFLSDNKNHADCNIANSIEEIKSNWQMPLTALNYHASSLSTAIFITSEQSGSQFEDFQAIAKRLVPALDNCKLLKYERHINFEDGEDVFNALKISYESLISSAIKKETIYIDLTGGTKVVALAGSIFALPEKHIVQYVSTTDKQVRLYDLQYHPQSR